MLRGQAGCGVVHGCKDREFERHNGCVVVSLEKHIAAVSFG